MVSRLTTTSEVRSTTDVRSTGTRRETTRMRGGIASRRDNAVLGTHYIVLVRGTAYGCFSPRNSARRAFVGAASGLGTQYVGRTRYSERQFTSLHDRMHLQILRLHIRRTIRRAIVLAPQRLQIVPQCFATIHIERRVC